MGSFVSEIFGDIRTQIGQGSAAVEIDLLESETYTSASSVTQHAVEDGSTISDHIQDQPDTLQLVAFFGQSLTDTEAQARAPLTRAEDLYQALLELKARKEALPVFTPRREYESMVIEKVTRPRSRADGDGVTVTIDFRQIRTATSQVVAAPPSRTARNPKRDQGKRPKKAANESQKQSSESLLSQWAG
jgi:hypothetical protein